MYFIAQPYFKCSFEKRQKTKKEEKSISQSIIKSFMEHYYNHNTQYFMLFQ